MGEKQDEMKGFAFNGSVRVEARDTRLTSNAGALLIREAMERSGLLASLKKKLEDPRNPALITHPLSELVATRLCLLALGHRDQDDADAHLGLPTQVPRPTPSRQEPPEFWNTGPPIEKPPPDSVDWDQRWPDADASA